MEFSVEGSYKVAQVDETNISPELNKLLREQCTFRDTDPELNEVIVSHETLYELFGSAEVDEEELAPYYAEVKALYELLGEEYSYLHITRV